MDLWRLPGPARFAEGVARELDRHSSAIVGLPARLADDTSWRDGFREALRYDVDLVDAVGAADRPTASIVAEGLGFGAEVGQGAPALLARRLEVEQRVIMLHVVDPDCTDASWARFCIQFVQSARGVEQDRRPLLVVLGGREVFEKIPATETSLAPHWWSGVTDRLDTGVFLAAESSLPRDAEVLRESIIEVAGFDLKLAQTLAQGWDGSESNLRDLLVEHRPIDDPGPDLPQERGDVHLGASAGFWDAGLVDRWDARDTAHVHSSLLVALKRTDLITMRLWRAQLRTVMPMIDEHRSRIADWLRGEVRAGYRLPEIPEAKDLYEAFQDHPQLKSWRGGHRKRLVYWLRDSRNELAHLRPLAMSEVQRGQRLILDDISHG